MFESFNLSELRKDFLSYQTEEKRREVETSCFSKVDRWRWARGEMWRPEASFDLWRPKWWGYWRNPWSIPLLMDVRHGMDMEGRCHAGERWERMDGDWFKCRITKICLIYSADRFDAVRYLEPDSTEIEVLFRFEFDGGKLARTLAMGNSFCSESRYVWKDSKPFEIYAIGAVYQSSVDEGIESSLEVGSRSRTQFFFDNRDRLQNVLVTYVDELGIPLPELEFQLFPRPISQRLVDAIYRWL